MCNYEAKSPLFMIKTAGFYHVPIKSYSKNTRPPSILKWILDFEFEYYVQSREKVENGLFMLKILFKTDFSCTFGGD